MTFNIPSSIRLAPIDMRAGFKAEIMAIVDAAVETDTPSVGNDFLTGTELADEIDGLGGNDVLVGLGGANKLYGGLGSDVILGGQQGQLFGDENSDNIGQRDFIFAENQHKAVLGGGGDDVIFGSAGDDIIRDGYGSDTVFGGDGQDNILSVQSPFDEDWNYLDGGNGDDQVSGVGTIIGGKGDDSIAGSPSTDDVLIGGRGRDLIGSALGDGDTIVYFSPSEGKDKVLGFETGNDVFQFDAVAFGVPVGTVLEEGKSFIVSDDPSPVEDGPTFLFDTHVGGHFSAALLFDPDGTGTEAAVKIAKFGVSQPSTPVNSDDIIFV